MAKGKAPFSLHRRPASKKEEQKKLLGKTGVRYVYYVQFRDAEGNYTSALSTGQSSRGAAEAWAHDYLKKGNIPVHRGFTFELFATDWWVDNKCSYVKEKERTGHPLSSRYILESRRNLVNHLLPNFGPLRLAAIRFNDVRKWMFDLYEHKGMNPATINRCLATLKVMCKEAVRTGYIQSNPCEGIGIFKEQPKRKTALARSEVMALLSDEALRAVWKNDRHQYCINMLAASTGMRLGEIQGLQRRHVYDSHIEVIGSWSRQFGLKDTKNHTPRSVTIPARTRECLKALMDASPHTDPGDLVFHGPNRGYPIDANRITAAFHGALEKIGISSTIRKTRNITFHSWRYFFNSECRANKIPDVLIRLMMGHKTPQMTDRYTSLNLDAFSDIRLLQERLLDASRPPGNGGDPLA